MNDRVYVLMEIAEGKTTRAVRVLRSKNGVVMADILEGSGRVMMVAEAPERRRLAELTIQALISVEAMVSQIQLLPVQNGLDTDIINMFSPAIALAEVGNLCNK